jgi:hypothetical protein
LADVIAEFERASQRSREIASRFGLEDTKDNPREGTAILAGTRSPRVSVDARPSDSVGMVIPVLRITVSAQSI